MSSTAASDRPVDATAPSSLPSRHLPLDGCVNFRDLGGYLTADGRQVRWRHLFRADGLNRLSGPDRAYLTDVGLATVIDLRTHDEAELRGRFPVDDVPVRYVGLPLTDVLPSTEELPEWREASFVASRYWQMLTKGAPVLSAAIETLAGADALPAVVHCSAGKDRTGVLSALVLAFLGVPDETIVDDYALSASAMDRLLERLKAEYPDSVEEVERYAPAVLHVAPETMVGFLSSVRAEYGSYDSLAEALGVTGAVVELRSRLLDEA